MCGCMTRRAAVLRETALIASLVLLSAATAAWGAGKQDGASASSEEEEYAAIELTIMFEGFGTGKQPATKPAPPTPPFRGRRMSEQILQEEELPTEAEAGGANDTTTALTTEWASGTDEQRSTEGPFVEEVESLDSGNSSVTAGEQGRKDAEAEGDAELVVRDEDSVDENRELGEQDGTAGRAGQVDIAGDVEGGAEKEPSMQDAAVETLDETVATAGEEGEAPAEEQQGADDRVELGKLGLDGLDNAQAEIVDEKTSAKGEEGKDSGPTFPTSVVAAVSAVSVFLVVVVLALVVVRRNRLRKKQLVGPGPDA